MIKWIDLKKLEFNLFSNTVVSFLEWAHKSDDKVGRCAGTRLPSAAKSAKERALANKLLDAQVDDSNWAYSGDGQHHRYELFRCLSVFNDAFKAVGPLCNNLLNLWEHRILINAKATLPKHLLLDGIMLLLQLIEHIPIPSQRTLMPVFHDSLLCFM